MKPTEWTFQIPEVLKLALKTGRAEFSVNYFKDSDKVCKTLTILRDSDSTTKCFIISGNSYADTLGNDISKFLNGEY